MSQIRDIFANLAADDAGKTAVVDSAGRTLDYHELSQHVDSLAETLKQSGIAAGETVGVCLPKTADSVICLLAVLRSGAAYVPVDAGGSIRRNGLIFTDSRVRAIFVEASLASEFSEQLDCPCDALDLPGQGLVLLLCRWNEQAEVKFAENLAMVLYTSGSTGKPKGVQITERNAATFIDWAAAAFSIRDDDICASIAPFHFDLSVFDLYVSLSRRACIILLDQKTCQNTLLLSSYLDKFKVSVCYTTPTVLNMLLNYGRLNRYDHSHIRLVLFAGEVISAKSLTQLQQLWPQSRFFNLYGPTESNVITYYPVPGLEDGGCKSSPPIGLPCDFALCRILADGALSEISPGVTGELVVSGPSVTPGYLADEEKNAQVFFNDEKGNRFYKTGDHVRTNENGLLQFVTRKDRMVKRKGYRIELEEIESILANHESAAEVAVSSWESSKGITIAAFFCQNPEKPLIKSSELKQFVLQYLPGYFLPDKYIFLNELPKTSSGKINYQELKALAL